MSAPMEVDGQRLAPILRREAGRLRRLGEPRCSDEVAEKLEQCHRRPWTGSWCASGECGNCGVFETRPHSR
jgi:hypothetical protein